MPQAIVDPQDLRRFAANLKHFKEELEAQLGVLHGQFTALGQTWRDREHQKFAQEFEQTLLAFRRFVAASEEQIPFLVRKAERIEDYLQQR